MKLIKLLVVAELCFLSYRLQVRLDALTGEYRSTEEVLYVTDGEALRKLTLGFESLAADLYWLRAVQYFGGQRLYATDKNFELLKPLLELTTTLDPHFKIPYRYGAVFLSEPPPRGAGKPLEGVELINKGIAENPDHWRFYLDKGFIYFWHLEDYRKASEVFLEGAEIDGAPYWMKSMAARALARGGGRETARQLWRHLYESSENEQMRDNAMTHLRQLDALDRMDELGARIEAFRERAGRFPKSWEELVAAGLLPGVPLDPTGVPFVLNPLDERVEISLMSTIPSVW